jgi:hypothetical protein
MAAMRSRPSSRRKAPTSRCGILRSSRGTHVLLTAMATVGAYIYNLSTDIVGGVEVTLADLD